MVKGELLRAPRAGVRRNSTRVNEARKEWLKSSSRDKYERHEPSYWGGGGKAPLLCGAGSEPRLGGTEKRRAKIVNKLGGEQKNDKNKTWNRCRPLIDMTCSVFSEL